jgi:hypothetical protein
MAIPAVRFIFFCNFFAYSSRPRQKKFQKKDTAAIRGKRNNWLIINNLKKSTQKKPRNIARLF